MSEMTLQQNVTQKLIWGIPLSAVVMGLAAAVCFPYYFMLLFGAYCITAILFFIVLDLPSMKLGATTKMVTLIKIVSIYVLASVFFNLWGYGLAQYEPENEIIKINSKLAKFQKAADEKAAALSEAAGIKLFKEKFEVKLEEMEEMEEDEDIIELMADTFDSMTTPARSIFTGNPIDKAKGKVEQFAGGNVSAEMIEKGRKVYNDYECYNCHVAEEGKVTKRRGPNFITLKLGAKKTPEWMRLAIVDPRAEMDEEYEKDPKLKKAMPADYKLQMFEEEIIAAVGFMMSFK